MLVLLLHQMKRRRGCNSLKRTILLVLREVLIDLIIVGLIFLTAFLLLKTYYPDYPSTLRIPEAAKYSKIEQERYKVVGDIQNEKHRTVKHETSTPIIETSQTELRYVPGSVNPFVANGGGSDLPSETVSRSAGESTLPVEENNTPIDDNGEPLPEQ